MIINIYTYKKVVCRFSRAPKVPASWNFGFKPKLCQLKTRRRTNFENLIFRRGAGSYGICSSTKIIPLVVHADISHLDSFKIWLCFSCSSSYLRNAKENVIFFLLNVQSTCCVPRKTICILSHCERRYGRVIKVLLDFMLN